EAAARRAGISAGTPVVAYDEAIDGGATRLWWLLRHHGHDAVAVLDGGLAAWREAGRPLRAGAEEDAPGDFESRPRDDDSGSAAAIQAGGFTLLDARAPERYAGTAEPIDPVRGHIPGAINVPFAGLAPGGHFLEPAELAGRIPEGELVAYCGSGVTA